MIRNINVKDVRNIVAQLCIAANISAPPDIKQALKSGLKNERSVIGKETFRILLKNLEIALKESIPICQDTGMAVVFLDIGQDVHITGGDIYTAVNDGVREGYLKGYLRKSVVDPTSRTNTKDNTPAVIHSEIIPGNKVRITVSPKGFGSENMSAIRMFNPTDNITIVEDFIVDLVRNAGAKPCPPIVVGVGIGGTFEKAAILAKKALLVPLNRKNQDKALAEFERSLLARINKLNIGPQGLGGNITALAVKALKYPTHIAGLPVAVNICCHVLRHKTKII